MGLEERAHVERPGAVGADGEPVGGDLALRCGRSGAHRRCRPATSKIIRVPSRGAGQRRTASPSWPVIVHSGTSSSHRDSLTTSTARRSRRACGRYERGVVGREEGDGGGDLVGVPARPMRWRRSSPVWRGAGGRGGRERVRARGCRWGRGRPRCSARRRRAASRAMALVKPMTPALAAAYTAPPTCRPGRPRWRRSRSTPAPALVHARQHGMGAGHRALAG